MYENPTISTAKTLVFVSAVLNLVLGILTCWLFLWGVPLIVAGAIMVKYRDFPTAEFLSKRTTMLVWGIVFVVMGNWIAAALLLIAYGTTAQFDNPAYYAQGPQGYGQPAYGPQGGAYPYPPQAYGQQYPAQQQAYTPQGQYSQYSQPAYDGSQAGYPAAQPNPYTQPTPSTPFSPEDPSGQGGQQPQQ